MSTLEAPQTCGPEVGLLDRAPMSRRCLLRTSDVDHAEEVGARLLSENHLRITHTPNFDARIHGASTDAISIFYLNYGTELEVVGPPLKDFIAVTLPLTGSMQVTLRTDRFVVDTGRSAAVIPNDKPLRMRWSPDFSMLCARIEVPALTEFVRHLTAGRCQRPLGFAQVITRSAALDAIWGAARLYMHVFDMLGPTDGLPPIVTAQLREHLLTALLFTQPNTYSSALLARTSNISHRAVQQAVDIIEAAPERPHTVTSIARAIGVSARSLQEGFRRRLGTSPSAYLQEVRLNRARRELILANTADGTTVAAIAIRWGFCNPGRFAGYYRSRFGESPSTTLATEDGMRPIGG
jgi:AraC-like DNA-binding protein